jgi:TIR domain
MGETVEPRIFISHASSDRDFAVELAETLRHAGLEPWIDTQEISPGDSFLAQMNAGLGTAGYVLLLVSAAAHVSRWVTREWLAALANEATVLVPVLLDDSGLPPLLKDIVYIDARQNRAAAIEAVLQFFTKETERPQAPARRETAPAEPGLSALNRRQLRMVAARCVDGLGLEAFCFDADINPNDLRGESVNEQLVALLHSISRDGLLKKFGRWLELERRRCVTNQIAELRSTPGWDWDADA